VAEQVLVQYGQRVDPLHQFDQQDEAVDPFGRDGQLRRVHPLSVPKNSSFG
jgi:hypothetical protein